MAADGRDAKILTFLLLVVGHCEIAHFFRLKGIETAGMEICKKITA